MLFADLLSLHLVTFLMYFILVSYTVVPYTKHIHVAINAHRLFQHTLQVVEMAWTDDSTLAIFFYIRYR